MHLRHQGSFALFSIAIVTFADAPSPVQAMEKTINTGFIRTRIDPFGGGESFLEADDAKFSLRIDARLPAIGASPTDVLADFLGLDVGIFSAKLRANAKGEAGLQFGYYVSGGQLSVFYPARSRIIIQTITPDSNKVPTLGFEINTAFEPGWTHKMIPVGLDNASFAGALRGPQRTAQLPEKTETAVLTGSASFQHPYFESSFPWASAYASLFYDMDLGGQFQVAVAHFLGECIGCFTKQLSVVGDAQEISLVKVNPEQLYIGGGLVDFRLDTPIPIGPLVITPHYPGLAIHSNPLSPGARDLVGSDDKPILTLRGAVTNAIPVVGQFIDGTITPPGLAYSLLALHAGPTLGLRQDMRLKVDPRISLEFNQMVFYSINGGPQRLGDKIEDVVIGTPIFIKPPRSASSDIWVKPTIRLQPTVSNNIHASLSAESDLYGPRISSSFASAGPIGHDHRNLPLTEVTVFQSEFPLHIAPVTSDWIKLRMVESFAELDLRVTGSQRIGTSIDGRQRFRLSLTDSVTGTSRRIDVEGDQQDVAASDATAQSVLVTDRDIRVAWPAEGAPDAVEISLGSVFCLECTDLSGAALPTSPQFTAESGEELFLSAITDPPNPDTCVACDPMLSSLNIEMAASKPTIVVGPTERVAALPHYFDTARSGFVAIGLKESDLGASGSRRYSSGPYISGAYVFPFSPSFGLQANATLAQSIDDDHVAQAGSATLFYRDDGWSLGGIIGIVRDRDAVGAVRAEGGGVEGNMYFGPASLGAAFGAANRHESGVDTDLRTLGVSARVFFSNHTTMTARIGRIHGDNAVDAFETRGASVYAEHELGRSPISVFAGVAHNEVDAPHSTDTRLSFGLRYAFGVMDPHTREENGASFRSFSDLLRPW
jgi:hypothetical protein